MSNSEIAEKKSLYFVFSKKIVLKTIIDSILIGLAYIGAYIIRFDFYMPDIHFQMFEKTILIAVLLDIVFLNLFRINQGRWRYSSVQDLINR